MHVHIVTRILFVVFGGLCLLHSRNVEAGVSDVAEGELFRLLCNRVAIVDIRTEPEWRETGIIPGSLLLPLYDEQRRLVDLEGWLRNVRARVPEDKPVILICRKGNRTIPATTYLANSGYARVYNATGGIVGWLRAGLPVQTWSANQVIDQKTVDDYLDCPH